jgi:integrase
MIDLGLADLTVKGHEQKIIQFLRFTDKPVNTTTAKDIRSFLMTYRNKAVKTYRNQLCSLKVFFRDFMKRGYLVESFKFPPVPLRVQNAVPSKREIQEFYISLPSIKERIVFLFLASSGLRISEGSGLLLSNINFKTRMIIPNSHRGGTKKSWLTFYNTECEQKLNEYMKSRDKNSEQLFQIKKRRIQCTFKKTSDTIGIQVTPQSLRRWFCSEMLRLGIQEIYIDAFCGRTPKSVLARHYTDYSPERLKKIYDKANLKVLS